MPTHEASNRKITSTRRSFLSVSAAFVATAQTGSAFLFRHSSPTDLGQLPHAWVKKEGEQKIQSYATYLEGLRLKFVSPLQIIQAHAKTKGSLWNTLPPKSMWRAMAGTLNAADRVASALGQPIKEVTSAYRSPAYNRRCPGAKSRSWHMQNFALDLQFSASPRTVASVARQLRGQGLFKGGIGRYSSFTHIDTRGTNVDW